jgi:DHA3 family macrolide efflux protein-like MFS transporter
VLIGGIVLGLVLGLLAGGTFGNLASIRLRRTWLLVIAVIVRYATEALLNAHIPIVESLRLPLLTSSFALLLAALWINRNYPGLNLAFVGILSNATVIVVNGGYMPIWEPSLRIAGFGPEDITNAIHTILPATLDASFLLHLGPLSDVIPIPLPFIQNVASVGDLFLTLGLAFFLFASVVRMPQELTPEQLDLIRQRLALETGLTPAIAESATLDRPLLMGGAGQRLASPSAGPFAADSSWTLEPEADGGGTVDASWPAAGSITRPIQRPTGRVIAPVRQHPYVRLALNSSFSALWAGQLISLFGDRIHTFAVVTLVYGATGSLPATGLVYLASGLPILFLSPIAGTFVDRWNQKEVVIVSDILRAGLVLLLPLAAMFNILLVYPMLFTLTTISIFFRPARVAILPRIVDQRDLLTANSALWVGETLADIVGIALAVAFVTALGDALPLAFWVDSATYLVSAMLLTTLALRAATKPDSDAAKKPAFFSELVDGWRFLRSEATLLSNTIQATIGQFTIGIMTALTAIYAIEVYGETELGWEPVFALIETGIGVGSVIGGFAIGLIGARLGRGRMVNVGYMVWGLMVVALALTDHVGVAIGVSFGQGVANMVFIIPTQALFQERTPQHLMGRVISFRTALVFGSITLGFLVGPILSGVVGVPPVIAFFGAVTIVAGLAGWFVPALRDA